MGNAQRLPNGNTFICWGYTNPNITEVTANGTIVFEMTLPTGDITYRATKDDWNGNPVAIKNDNTPVPSLFKLNQNYPNPFNPSTRITYEIAKSSNVKLTIFDVLGREVAVLLNTKQQPGTYEVVWDAVNFPSGVYFYKIQTDYYASTRKMTLLK